MIYSARLAVSPKADESYTYRTARANEVWEQPVTNNELHGLHSALMYVSSTSPRSFLVVGSLAALISCLLVLADVMISPWG
jgi:hypothetical protein